MRLLKTLLISVTALGAVALNGCSNGYSISQAELQQKIDDNLPVSQSVDLFLFTPQINLDSLALDLGRVEANKVNLAGGVSFTGIPGVAPVAAKMSISGRPEFIADEGNIYLREINVRSLQLQGESPTGTPLDLWLANSALDVLSQMATQYFAQYPIYSLEQGSLTQQALQRFGRDVTVGDGELTLSLAP